jgi:hypothetical protein
VLTDWRHAAFVLRLQCSTKVRPRTVWRSACVGDVRVDMSRYAAKSAVTKYSKIPLTIRLRGIAQKVSAVIYLKTVIGAERSKRWLGCPTDRCCGTYISTTRAVCRHSLHLQTKRASPKKADAQGHDPFFSGCICSEGREPDFRCKCAGSGAIWRKRPFNDRSNPQMLQTI